jgi:hypothetical protein
MVSYYLTTVTWFTVPCGPNLISAGFKFLSGFSLSSPNLGEAGAEKGCIAFAIVLALNRADEMHDNRSYFFCASVVTL